MATVFEKFRFRKEDLIGGENGFLIRENGFISNGYIVLPDDAWLIPNGVQFKTLTEFSKENGDKIQSIDLLFNSYQPDELLNPDRERMFKLKRISNCGECDKGCGLYGEEVLNNKHYEDCEAIKLNINNRLIDMGDVVRVYYPKNIDNPLVLYIGDAPYDPIGLLGRGDTLFNTIIKKEV